MEINFGLSELPVYSILLTYGSAAGLDICFSPVTA